MEFQQNKISRKRIGIILAAAGFILILLLVVIVLISKQKKTTVTVSSPDTISARKQAEIELIKDKIKSSPVETADFILRLEPTSKNITITKKTPQADEAIKKWLKVDNIPDVLHSVQLTNKEIASKVLLWLDKTRVYGDKLKNPSETGEYISNGGYALGQYCEDNLVCRSLLPANNFGLYAVWARFKSFESNNDPVALAILQKDLAIYSDSKSISAIQPQLWSFRLMYEIWKSPLLGPEQKEKVKTIFYRIQHNPEVIKPVEDIVKKKGTIAEINIPLFQKGLYNTDEGMVYAKLNTYAAYSSEYLYIYLFAKDSALNNPDQFLYTARGLFNNAVRSYLKYGLANDDDPALLGVAALDMYNVTQNKQYLDFASFLYEKNIANQTCKQMDQCATMLYFADILNKQIPDQKKANKIKQTIKDLYKQKFDYEGADGYQLGVEAFYDLNMELKKNTSYGLMANALMVSVLSEFKQ